MLVSEAYLLIETPRRFVTAQLGPTSILRQFDALRHLHHHSSIFCGQALEFSSL